jgi:hypothetical protein
MNIVWFSLVSFAFLADAAAQGILAYKTQNYHKDSDAKILVFDSIQPEGFVTWVTVKGKRLRFEKTNFHTWVILPRELPQQIILDEEKKELSEAIKEIRDFTSRFPGAKQYTQETIDFLESAQRSLANGKVWKQSNWITAQEHEKSLEEARIAENMVQRRLEEAKANKLRLAKLEAEEIQRLAKAERAAMENRRIKMIEGISIKINQIEQENKYLNDKIDEVFITINGIHNNAKDEN